MRNISRDSKEIGFEIFRERVREVSTMLEKKFFLTNIRQTEGKIEKGLTNSRKNR